MKFQKAIRDLIIEYKRSKGNSARLTETARKNLKMVLLSAKNVKPRNEVGGADLYGNKGSRGTQPA